MLLFTLLPGEFLHIVQLAVLGESFPLLDVHIRSCPKKGKFTLIYRNFGGGYTFFRFQEGQRGFRIHKIIEN